jgi:hypothetical protein
VGKPVETCEEMKKLLILLAESFEWLFSDYDFTIIHSEYSPSFGGEGLIRLTNSILRIDLISDRDSAFLEFSPIGGWEVGETVTYDLIRELLTDEICDETTITASQIEFLRANFKKIISLFESPKTGETLKKIKTLKKERAKRLF